MNDAMVSRTTGISDVTITQPASAALAKKSPHLSMNLIVATIVGVLLGLGIVFLVDWFDGRIRDERDVENELQLPVLASIPQLPSGDGAAAIPASVRNATLESYFQLVLAMRYSSDHPLRSVTVTSPLKGDGKSTVAMNVASAFGEIAVSSIEREARVLIIDADMRRPSLHKKFEVSNDVGLSDLLIGRASLAQCVKRTDRPGVDVLTSGTHSPNPIKLLQSNRFDALLREARSRYETVIVDAPALVPVFDAAVVAAKTDGTVMILSAGHTDVRSTRKALARLEAVGVNDLIGTVVNRSTTHVDDYSDYFAVGSRAAQGAAAHRLGRGRPPKGTDASRASRRTSPRRGHGVPRGSESLYGWQPMLKLSTVALMLRLRCPGFSSALRAQRVHRDLGLLPGAARRAAPGATRSTSPRSRAAARAGSGPLDLALFAVADPVLHDARLRVQHVPAWRVGVARRAPHAGTQPRPSLAEYLNGPMWSIALECQIYVVFALLLVPVWRRFGPARSSASRCSDLALDLTASHGALRVPIPDCSSFG